MDYLEGLFLGSLWSDTDYENRKHVSLFILYGMFVFGCVLFSYFTGQFSDILGQKRELKLAVYLLLFLASPFLCFRYYRYPLWVKIPILAVEASKYFVMTVLFTTWVMPYMSVSASDLQTRVVEFLNETLESSTKMFTESAGTFSTVLGVITGGIYIVFLFAAVMILLVLIPGIVILTAKLLQYGYDKLISKLVLGTYIDR